MKNKPNPLAKRAIQQWNDDQFKSEETQEDRLLQEAKDQLRLEGVNEKAKKVLQVMKDHCTKRQIEIFMCFTETENFSQTANKLGVAQPYVFRVVEKVRKIVIENMAKTLKTVML